MLRPELLQKFMQNAAFEKGNLFQREADHLLGHEQYKDLMVFVFEEQQNVPLFFVVFSCFQYCASLNLCPQTSYLAKTYLDIIFNKSNFLDIAQLPLLSICSIWMAIKFNEPYEVSHYFSVEIMCQHGGHAFSGRDLLAMELRILQFLQFKLSYTTPYDYIEPFFYIFPWMLKAKSALRSIIELSGAISYLRNESAGDVFYGSFMGIIELKQCILQPLQKNVLDSQIRDAQKIRAISRAIVHRYNQMLQSEQKDGSEMQSEQTQSQ